MEKKSEMTSQEMRSLIKKTLVRFTFFPLVLGLLVLLPAGTLDYWQVYVYLGILVLPMIFALFYFLRVDPRFLERRTRAKEKEKEQKWISMLSSLVFLAGFIIPGLDHRFSWSQVPALVSVSADCVILLGYLIVFFVFRQNSYASRIIEVEEEQKVISTGLYGIVRHPMYVGVLVMFLPTSLALGSYWGLIPFALFPLSLALRILNEEKVLSANLEGYKEYCQKTKYRLIPFLW